MATLPYIMRKYLGNIAAFDLYLCKSIFSGQTYLLSIRVPIPIRSRVIAISCHCFFLADIYCGDSYHVNYIVSYHHAAVGEFPRNTRPYFEDKPL